MAECVCLKCGYEGRPRIEKPGKKSIEVIMWTVFMVPGPFYTAWRIAARKKYCPHCGAVGMVSTRSEKGIIFLYEQDQKLFNPDPPKF